jgi:hypothetical protein
MVLAYLLINTDLGAKSRVLEALKKFEGVDEVNRLRGVYDIIARVKADSVDKLRFISKSIGGNGDITAKLTVLVSEN